MNCTIRHLVSLARHRLYTSEWRVEGLTDKDEATPHEPPDPCRYASLLSLLFVPARPNTFKATQATTGLSDDDSRKILTALCDAGLAISIRPKTDYEARVAHASTLINANGFSLRAAAREVGLDHSNLRRKLARSRETVPNAERRHKKLKTHLDAC